MGLTSSALPLEDAVQMLRSADAERKDAESKLWQLLTELGIQ
jgi:hypothetical protein